MNYDEFNVENTYWVFQDFETPSGLKLQRPEQNWPKHALKCSLRNEDAKQQDVKPDRMVVKVILTLKEIWFQPKSFQFFTAR